MPTRSPSTPGSSPSAWLGPLQAPHLRGTSAVIPVRVVRARGLLPAGDRIGVPPLTPPHCARPQPFLGSQLCSTQ